ncbi:MAG: hypothetical protein Q4B18_08725 [Bacillota bacterium]|nr:hypothetical protein [Bacillota bacterium]
MENNDKKKKEPWRFIVRIICIAFIVYVWVEKDIVSTLITIPKEQFVSIVVPHLIVYLMAIAVISGGVFMMKRIAGKRKKK